MTAPRWIVEALGSMALTDEMVAFIDQSDGPYALTQASIDTLAAALLERLPIEAMVEAARHGVGPISTTGEQIAVAAVVAGIKAIAGDHDVVTIAELYQGACRVLDDAGVPHAVDERRDGTGLSGPPRSGQLHLDLAGRIRWLAQQRPTRLDLQRVISDRDAQLELRAAAERERDAARREVDDLKERLLKAETERDALLELRGRAAVREEQRPVPEIPIAPLPELIRCTRPECSSTLDRALLDIAAVSVDWFQLDGYWFCPACRIAAPWIVALDREKNAHQATICRLEQARDRIAELEHAAAGVSP